MVSLSQIDAAPSDPEHLTYRTFRDRPGSYFVKAFAKHVRDTGRPETFPGLHPGPLDKAEPFTKLRPFDIERLKRPDGDMAPCPMCHSSNKYLSGSLVYLPRLQAVAAIGHECADKETRAAADREYKARLAKEREEDYLLAHLPLIPARLVTVDQLRPAAHEARRVYRLFRRDASSIQRLLRAVKQQGGRLIVSEQLKGEVSSVGPAGFKGTSGIQTRDISFGSLGGSIAVINNYDPVAELDYITRILRNHDNGDSEEAALEYIVSLSDSDRARATVELQECERAFRKSQSRLADFRAFFRAANIARIKAWASHSEHPAPFEIVLSENGDKVILKIRSQTDRLHVVFDTSMQAQHCHWPSPEERSP